MLSKEQLSAALLLALSSNAVLLLVVLFRSADVHREAHGAGKRLCTSTGPRRELAAKLQQPGVLDRDALLLRDFVLTVDRFNDIEQHVQPRTAAGFRLASPAFQHVLLSLLKYKLSKLGTSRRPKIYNPVLDKLFVDDSPAKGHEPTRGEDSTEVTDGRSATSSFVDQNGHGVNYSHRADGSWTGELHVTRSDGRTNPALVAAESASAPSRREVTFQLFSGQNQTDSDDQRNSFANISRSKRGAGSEPVNGGVPEQGQNRINEIFSTFTQVEMAEFPAPVSRVLIPALVQFEGMLIKELERLHAVAVAHDLRLEVLEKAMLTAAEGHAEIQADAVDNKSQLVSGEQVLGGEQTFVPAGNSSNLIELVVPLEGSGEGETSPAGTSTSRSPGVTPWRVPEYYELFRHLSTLEQKVLTLENYNIMSDSELTRVRSEVIKMDDKVTELDRRNRNLQIRMSMHAVKISEMEMFKNKAEMTLQTSQEAYGRVNNRLDAFKERLAGLKTDLRGITSQFTRHDQISSELRAADAYKAHDIQEMRKNIFGIEGRLNNLYSTFDKNVQLVRSDVRGIMERLCSKNKLSC
ncbi:unnamed protein product [Lymnaea stagnalis]|uniref:Uncharacterized protein n=1 Tax=Lymnaea stagnalis TaxID=6523 RepID=A0AAV2IQT1_LYMST